MCPRQLLFVVAASLAEGLHRQPTCIYGRHATIWSQNFLIWISHTYHLLDHIGQSCIASHARGLLLLRVTLCLLALAEQVQEPLPPRLLVLSRRKRFENPAELLLGLGKDDGWPRWLAARLLRALRLELELLVHCG